MFLCLFFKLKLIKAEACEVTWETISYNNRVIMDLGKIFTPLRNNNQNLKVAYIFGYLSY